MAAKQCIRDFEALEQRRLKAAQLLGNGMRQAEVARALGVSRQSVSTWAKALKRDQEAWRCKPMGYAPGLGPAEREWLHQILVRGAQAYGFATDVWTVPRVGAVIRQAFNISYGKSNVWLILKAMGFSCQKPTGRATQRDEDAIQNWKYRRWPALKKKRAERAESSSSSMKRG
jgi:transposase